MTNHKWTKGIAVKFCSECGSDSINEIIPEGDDRLRFVCGKCNMVHYQNPKAIVGCIPFYQDKILLCKRAIEPRKDYWTLPAGFLENGESITDGAIRETLEEANARVRLINMYSIYNIPHISQVHILFRAELEDLNFYAGPESSDVRLFTLDEIDWNNISFMAVRETIRHYFNDFTTGQYRLRIGDITYSMNENHEKVFKATLTSTHFIS